MQISDFRLDRGNSRALKDNDMKNSLKLCYVLGCLIILPRLGFAQDNVVPDVVVKSVRVVEPFRRKVPWEIDLGSTGSIDIKLTTPWGMPLVEITANNQGPFTFLVDTGADSSIISNELANKLKLTAIETKKSEFHTPHQKATIDTKLFIVDELKIGEAVLKNVPFIASNTATDDFYLLKNLNVVGILGINLFHDIILTLDLPKQKISLSSHQDNIKGNKLNINKSFYVPMIKAQVESNKTQTEYDLLIDSGYSGFIKMPVCFSYEERGQHPGSIVTYDVFNEQDGGFISELDGTFVLGEKKIDNPLVKYTVGHCEDRKKWGLIGTAYLQYQSVSIDQKNREVIIH